MAGREELNNFDVFLVVAVYFIGLGAVVLSGLYQSLSYVPDGFLLMIVANLYERVRILEEGGTDTE